MSTKPRLFNRPLPFLLGIVFAAALSATALGCGSTTPSPMEARAEQRPRLVVSLVFDQFGSDTLERYLPYLDDDGYIRRAVATGAHHRIQYPYSGTFTAPGHTSLHTGTTPSEHGVGANAWWDVHAGEMRQPLNDGKSEIFGAPGTFTSPTGIKTKTVADMLKDATGGKARVVGVSLKDRGSIPCAGHQADMAVWYNKQNGEFTTSTYYAEQMPAWLAEWNVQNPTAERMNEWTPEDPELLQRVLGPDDQPGEGGSWDYGSTFPHDPRKAGKPFSSYRATPQSTKQTFDLARKAVEHYGLGQDDVPDLLTVSISGTDYVGHVFGPHSWEYMDNLIRVDRMAGEFVRWLATRTSVAVVLSSDHGVAPLAEVSQRLGHDGSRNGLSFLDPLNAHLNEKLGKPEGTARDGGEAVWVETFIKPLIYFSEQGDARRDEIAPLAIEFLKKNPRIHGAYDPRKAEQLRKSEDRIERAAGLTVFDPNVGHLVLVPAPYNVFDEGSREKSGTSHGSPWEYDNTVPSLAWGAGVSQSQSTEPLPHSQYAATLAKLLGVKPPPAVTTPAIPGVQ